MSIFRKHLAWLSWANHRNELVPNRRYLVCDTQGHVAACVWSGADFILDLGGFDQKQVRGLAKAAAAAAVGTELHRLRKRALSPSEEEAIAQAVDERFEDELPDLAPDFACPMWFMPTPPPPGPEAWEADDVPAAVFDNGSALLEGIERLVMEHEAKRFKEPTE